MDLTAEFETHIQKLTGTRKRPRPKRYTPLNDASSLVAKINKMKSHLTKYGHDYLNTYGDLPEASRMSDEKRRKLDHDVEEFINLCNDKMKMLQSELLQSEMIQAQKAQVEKLQAENDLGSNVINPIKELRDAVIESIWRILNDFVKYYTQLRTTRMKRYMEKQKYDRIECATGRISPSKEYESISQESFDITSIQSDRNATTTDAETQANSNSNSFSFEDYQNQSLTAAEHDTTISHDELQMLALENTQIHDELLTLNDEIKMVGKKVVQISRLQELFTEKVMEQELELNNLHETAIRSSENVREGNDLIREAMMKNASTRVFILFYIITLGFTILFLDWYNP